VSTAEKNAAERPLEVRQNAHTTFGKVPMNFAIREVARQLNG